MLSELCVSLILVQQLKTIEARLTARMSYRRDQLIKKSFASCSHFVVALLAIALMLALPTVAHAETKRYSVPNASFEIWLNDDGSAEVEETWEVTYKEGDFTRFFKDIYTSGLETEERFSNISVKK